MRVTWQTNTGIAMPITNMTSSMALNGAHLTVEGDHNVTGADGQIYHNLGDDSTKLGQALTVRKILGCAPYGKTAEALTANGISIPGSVIDGAVQRCGCPGARPFAETPKSEDLSPTSAHRHIYVDVIYCAQQRYLILVGAHTGLYMITAVKDRSADRVFRAHPESFRLLFGKTELIVSEAGREFGAQSPEGKASQLSIPIEISAPEPQHSRYAERIWQIVQKGATRLKMENNKHGALIMSAVACHSAVTGGYPPPPEDYGNRPDNRSSRL